jgi:glycosyltransferase involved in cell wall biosynthesis
MLAMKIAVNTRLLLKNKLEGIGWFTFENLKRMVESHPEHEFYFLFDRPYDTDFIFAPNIKPVKIGLPTRHPLLWMLWFECSIPFALRKIKPDIFISPDGFISLHTKTPQIAVIHDLNFHHRPMDLPFWSRMYYRHFFPKFAKKAKHIITVSQYSKNDLCASYHINPDKISVVYNGAQELYKELTEEQQNGTKARYAMGKNYFLFVGAQHPRKNIDGLLQAFDLFKANWKTEHKLIIVGEKQFLTSKIEETYKNMAFKKEVLFTGRLSSEEIALVMGSATALVYVPFFEGFGIPIVEAFYAGIPVIASNVTALPEIADDAALYVNPSSPEDIAQAMNKISSDDLLRKQLIKKGKLKRPIYQWDKSALELWDIIGSTVSQKE